MINVILVTKFTSFQNDFVIIVQDVLPLFVTSMAVPLIAISFPVESLATVYVCPVYKKDL